MSALVVGAVAPDLPVYLPVGASYATTHSWPGLPVVVFFGMVLVWLWFLLLKLSHDGGGFADRRVRRRGRLDRIRCTRRIRHLRRAAYFELVAGFGE